MPSNRLTALGVAASIALGLVIAILAVTGSGALSLTALIGGILVGALWVGIGMVRRGRDAG